MSVRRRWISPTIVVIVFAMGVLFGAHLPSKNVEAAQQQFRPGDLKNVPTSFLQGGDRSYTVLQEMKAVLQEIAQRLEDVNSTAMSIDDNIQTGLKKLDSANDYLQKIQPRNPPSRGVE